MQEKDERGKGKEEREKEAGGRKKGRKEGRKEGREKKGGGKRHVSTVLSTLLLIGS